MKKTIMILAAIALVLGLPQCKKQTTGVLEGSVEITLNVSANKGSRINVDPDSGDVAFEQNDVVYVGSGGKFVGTLTFRGTRFTGQITNATLGEPLYFFFLGNKTPAETLTAGTSTTCSVNIGDQTSKLPVISFATSDQDFTGQGTYTAFFLNKAALVKFDVAMAMSPVPACILGMNNKVAVDFSTNGFAYSQVDDGCIQLQAGSGERWAILLPQASGTHTVTAGLGGGISTAVEVPTIAENAYLTSGIDVLLGVVDLGLPSGLLWATCNIGAETPEGYGGYFAWGETVPKNDYQWSSYLYCNGDYNQLTKYCNNPSYGYNGFIDNLTTLEPSDDAATAHWGGNFRIPTKEEFEELYNNTTVTLIQQNDVNGYLFTALDGSGNSLFLPLAGYRYRASLVATGDAGYYWSSSLLAEPDHVGFFFLSSTHYYANDERRYRGHTVRPVCPEL